MGIWQKARNRWVIFTHDLLWVPLSIFVAYWIRFNLDIIPDEYIQGAMTVVLASVPAHAFAFWVFGCYRGVWRFASIPDLMRLLWAVGLGALSTLLIVFLWTRLEGVPRSVLVLYPMLLLGGVCGARVAYRAFKDHGFRFDAANRQRALVVGAGQGGEVLVRDLCRNGPFYPAAVVDDDPVKLGQEIHGIRVRGVINDIPDLIDALDIDTVLIAMPSASRETMDRIVSMCVEVGVECRTLPSLAEIADGRVEAARLRPVTVEDLLGRDPVVLDEKAINEFLQNKRVL
ncbi:MAG: polysaccharide biosynthesis protein, partial [Gammaproteobacteria bacterium]|nr:polysaccharide biosynthesis protein [Gammaproteobacteria bacterium]